MFGGVVMETVTAESPLVDWTAVFHFLKVSVYSEAQPPGPESLGEVRGDNMTDAS